MSEREITDRLNGNVPSILAMRDGALAIFALRREVKSIRDVSLTKDAEIERLRTVNAALVEQLQFCVGNLEGIFAGTDIPSTAILSASRAALALAKGEKP